MLPVVTNASALEALLFPSPCDRLAGGSVALPLGAGGVCLVLERLRISPILGDDTSVSGQQVSGDAVARTGLQGGSQLQRTTE